MWDYSYAVISLTILFIFICFYLLQPRISIKINRVFVLLFLSEFLATVSDIFACIACNNYTRLSGIALYTINAIYFALSLLRSQFFFSFTSAYVGTDHQTDRLLLKVSWSVTVIGIAITLSSFFSGSIFYFDETGYHTGTWFFMTYWIYIIHLALSFLTVWMHRHSLMIRSDIWKISAYLTVILGGLALRPYLMNILIFDIACSSAIEIIYLSFADPKNYLDRQTAVFNYAAFMDYNKEFLSVKPFVIHAFTIHNYTELLEVYGNLMMDQGIQSISDYLKKEFPDQILFYYKKGCFAMISAEEKALDHAILEKIRHRFQSPWVFSNTELYFEAKCFTIDSDIKLESADMLAKLLNYAFEKVDSLDNNSTLFLSEEDLDICNRTSAVKRFLETALEQNQVQTYLQPIISAKTGKLEGAEALCRILDDSGNVISPIDFIPLAEKSGQIIKLGEQVFERTCQFMQQNDLDALGIKWINVNLSPLQFFKRDLADTFFLIAQKYNVDPDMIHLEITEEYMIDYNLFTNQINALTGKGFHFVLDDYGTGYSNIDRLSKCPFINIKLDKTVVTDYHNNSKILLPHLVDAFKQIGFTITAEGIETAAMAESMADLGCDYLQGFLYAPPMSMQAFLAKYSGSIAR